MNSNINVHNLLQYLSSRGAWILFATLLLAMSISVSLAADDSKKQSNQPSQLLGSVSSCLDNEIQISERALKTAFSNAMNIGSSTATSQSITICGRVIV